MEKDLFWFQNLDQQSPNLNFLDALLDTGQQNIASAYMKPHSIEIFRKGSFPSYGNFKLPQSRACQLDEAHNGLCYPPCISQAFAPLLVPSPNKKPFENTGGHEIPKIEAGYAQKQFLVFDQSGDQTTLMYSSGIDTALPCLDSWNPKPPAPYDWHEERPGINRGIISPLASRSGPFLNDEYDEGNQKDEAGSEMHEDTEELNALLYSDYDDDYSEDAEETSTGHSPSTMTSHDIQGSLEEKCEETPSAAESTKRHKLVDGGYEIPSFTDASVMDAANSLKCFSHSELGDDAESCCGNDHGWVSREFSSLSGKKRSRKEDIRETVRILQSIIPDGKAKGKGTVEMIDDAIHYLRSLKAKAKDLGLDALTF